MPTEKNISERYRSVFFSKEIKERVARAICDACEEDPDYKGDCRGNEFRWQDYLPVANAAIDAVMAEFDEDGRRA